MLEFTKSTNPALPEKDSAHDPCGYWYKGLVPFESYIKVSKLYPVDVQEGFISQIGFIGGVFREALLFSEMAPEAFSISEVLLFSGHLDLKGFLTYITKTESITVESLIVDSGLHREVIFSMYDNGIPEEFEVFSILCASGILRIALLSYTYWAPEGFIASELLITGGSHGTG